MSIQNTILNKLIDFQNELIMEVAEAKVLHETAPTNLSLQNYSDQIEAKKAIETAISHLANYVINQNLSK